MPTQKRKTIYNSNVPQEDFGTMCRCGRRVILKFNGGEGDRVQCGCGRIYTMEIKRIDIMMEVPRKEKPHGRAKAKGDSNVR